MHDDRNYSSVTEPALISPQCCFPLHRSAARVRAAFFAATVLPRPPFVRLALRAAADRSALVLCAAADRACRASCPRDAAARPSFFNAANVALDLRGEGVPRAA